MTSQQSIDRSSNENLKEWAKVSIICAQIMAFIEHSEGAFKLSELRENVSGTDV